MKNLEQLFDIDSSLKKDLKELKKAAAAPAKRIAKHLFTDTLCPWVGNRFAYKDFLSRNRNHGFHVSIDLNSFSEINKKYGHLVGDEAIQQFFKASSSVSRMLKGKNFRVGGDENRLYFSDKQKAEQFAAQLEKNLKSEKVKDFNLSASIGIGYTPEQAEEALKQAKQKLRNEPHPKGSEPTVIVSLLNQDPPAHWEPSSRFSTVEKTPILKVKL